MVGPKHQPKIDLIQLVKEVRADELLNQLDKTNWLKVASTIQFGILSVKVVINMTFTLPSSNQAKPRQPRVRDGDFINKGKPKVIASKLFEEPIISKNLKGKGASLTLAMPIDEACNHVRPLYIIAQFDGQLVSKVLVDNQATLNVLPVYILRKVGTEKSDMLPTDLIRINFCGTTA